MDFDVSVLVISYISALYAVLNSTFIIMMVKGGFSAAFYYFHRKLYDTGGGFMGNKNGKFFRFIDVLSKGEKSESPFTFHDLGHPREIKVYWQFELVHLTLSEGPSEGTFYLKNEVNGEIYVIDNELYWTRIYCYSLRRPVLVKEKYFSTVVNNNHYGVMCFYTFSEMLDFILLDDLEFKDFEMGYYLKVGDEKRGSSSVNLLGLMGVYIGSRDFNPLIVLTLSILTLTFTSFSSIRGKVMDFIISGVNLFFHSLINFLPLKARKFIYQFKINEGWEPCDNVSLKTYFSRGGEFYTLGNSKVNSMEFIGEGVDKFDSIVFPIEETETNDHSGWCKPIRFFEENRFWFEGFPIGLKTAGEYNRSWVTFVRGHPIPRLLSHGGKSIHLDSFNNTLELSKERKFLVWKSGNKIVSGEDGECINSLITLMGIVRTAKLISYLKLQGVKITEIFIDDFASGGRAPFTNPSVSNYKWKRICIDLRYFLFKKPRTVAKGFCSSKAIDVFCCEVRKSQVLECGRNFSCFGSGGEFVYSAKEFDSICEDILDDHEIKEDHSELIKTCLSEWKEEFEDEPTEECSKGPSRTERNLDILLKNFDEVTSSCKEVIQFNEEKGLEIKSFTDKVNEFLKSSHDKEPMEVVKEAFRMCEDFSSEKTAKHFTLSTLLKLGSSPIGRKIRFFTSFMNSEYCLKSLDLNDDAAGISNRNSREIVLEMLNMDPKTPFRDIKKKTRGGKRKKYFRQAGKGMKWIDKKNAFGFNRILNNEVLCRRMLEKGVFERVSCTPIKEGRRVKSSIIKGASAEINLKIKSGSDWKIKEGVNPKLDKLIKSFKEFDFTAEEARVRESFIKEVNRYGSLRTTLISKINKEKEDMEMRNFKREIRRKRF